LKDKMMHQFETCQSSFNVLFCAAPGPPPHPPISMLGRQGYLRERTKWLHHPTEIFSLPSTLKSGARGGAVVGCDRPVHARASLKDRVRWCIILSINRLGGASP